MEVGDYRLGYMDQYSETDGAWIRPQWYLGRDYNLAEIQVKYDSWYESYGLKVSVHFEELIEKLTRRQFTGVTPAEEHAGAEKQEHEDVRADAQ